MIDYIRGKIDTLTPTDVVVEAAGVGYVMGISLSTYAALQGKEEVKVYVSERISEDAHVLFGFATRGERECFELLISVSGIGGQTARLCLSAFTPAELANTIATENVGRLKAVKGIGPKAAQRIIVELKDKMLNASFAGEAANASSPKGTAGNAEVAEEAVSALTMLGFPTPAARTAVGKAQEEMPSAKVEILVKMALKLMK